RSVTSRPGMREERSSSRSAVTAPQRDDQNRSRSVPWYSLVRLCARRRKRASALCQNCVTYPPETRGQHRHLRGDAHAHRCCEKVLIGTVLVGFRVRLHARRESISKRARSTTPTSLRFRINELRTVRNSVTQNPPSNPIVQQIDSLQRFADMRPAIVSGIVSDLLM